MLNCPSISISVAFCATVSPDPVGDQPRGMVFALFVINAQPLPSRSVLPPRLPLSLARHCECGKIDAVEMVDARRTKPFSGSTHTSLCLSRLTLFIPLFRCWQWAIIVLFTRAATITKRGVWRFRHHHRSRIFARYLFGSPRGRSGVANPSTARRSFGIPLVTRRLNFGWLRGPHWRGKCILRPDGGLMISSIPPSHSCATVTPIVQVSYSAKTRPSATRAFSPLSPPPPPVFTSMMPLAVGPANLLHSLSRGHLDFLVIRSSAFGVPGLERTSH